MRENGGAPAGWRGRGFGRSTCVSPRRSSVAPGFRKVGAKTDFPRLFGSQVSRLRELGVPEEIVRDLCGQRKTVLETVSSGLTIPSKMGKILPFVPVIPGGVFSLDDQLRAVFGVCPQWEANCFPSEPAETEPRWLTWVGWGKLFRGSVDVEVQRHLRRNGYRPLDVSETVSFGLVSRPFGSRDHGALRILPRAGSGRTVFLFGRPGGVIISHLPPGERFAGAVPFCAGRLV